jgi:hypothetical protein
MKKDKILRLKQKKKDRFIRADLVLEKAHEVGYVEIFTAELTKWNYHHHQTDSDLKKHGEEERFDVEGHSSSDVYAVWNIRWWERRHWHTIKDNLIYYIQSVYDFVISDFFFWLRKDPKVLLKKIKRWVFQNPFKIEQQGWVWVVDSLSAEMKKTSYILADDIISKERGFKNSRDLYRKKKEVNDFKEVEKLANHIMSTEEGRQKVFDYAVKESRLIKVTDYMWVNKDDPTCFVVDDGVVPYDMRDGWSPEMLADIISEWFGVFYNIRPHVKVRP